MIDERLEPSPPPERVGKYEILRHIATGGMGAVYQARDVDLDRLVALKIVPAELARQEKILVRFRREAQAAAQLRHENIVAIFDVGECDGTHFLALEFIDGTDLQDYINRQCRLDPEVARQIMIQATRALVHAHEQGIVHRDIKPSNFLLTFEGNKVRVKLTDFGLAMRRENEEEFRITRDGTTVGTVDYLSPEQARDSQSADIRSDIYSLGCTFFHMLAGVAPFAKGSMPERLILHMQKLPPDLRKYNKTVPSSLVAIVNRMLEKDPEDRYQTPAELLHALEHVEKINAEAKKSSAAGKSKPGRGARPPVVDLTAVVENQEVVKEDVEAAPVKAARAKAVTEEANKERTRVEPKPRPTMKKRSDPAKEKDNETSADMDSDSSERIAKPISKKEKATRPAKTKQPTWVIIAAGSAGALVLFIILALALGGRPPRPKEVPKTDPTPKVVLPPQKIEPPAVAAIDTAPAKMSAGAQPLLVMDSPPASTDPAAFKEYYGPCTAFPAAPPTAKKLRVSRLATGGADSYRTIADALAAAEPNVLTVIEIQDNGPLFVRVLPAVAQRSILLRGATGYRPLLAWEVPKTPDKEKAAPALLPFTQGKLILENLDVVVKWPDARPATLFDLHEADFYARDCTFSLTGKSIQGITLLSNRPFEPEPSEPRPTLTWLQRCYVRGADLTLVDILKTSAFVLLEDSLIVGQNQPLLQLRERDQDIFSWSCIRSTVVTGQTLLRWQSFDGGKAAPQMQGMILDSILSRDDPASPLGDLVHLAAGAEPSRMKWKATNSVYAGWKKLLASDEKQIGGTDLAGWHRQWHHSSGDRALVEPWPANPLSRLEEAPASMFLLPVPSPLAYRALSSSGAIGAALGRLPADLGAWSERTFDLLPEPVLTAGDGGVPPAIAADADGLYHGEKLDLNKIADLGVYLNNTLQKMKPAPRVVLHLSGAGSHLTSAIRVKGIAHLVLYFEPSKDRNNPLILGINPTTIKARTPLIEMVGGHLELIGARMKLSPLTLVSALVHVQDGDLALTQCWLQGPLPKAPQGFKALLSLSSSTASPATLWLRDNVLLSSKLLLLLQDDVQLKARNNVLFSLGDGVHFTGTGSNTGMTHLLDHNTWAVRQTVFTLALSPQFAPAAPLRMYANSNAFLNPFTPDSGTSILLRGAEAPVAHATWIWQGRHNVYGARLHAYFAELGKPATDEQALRDWQQAWGETGEAEPLVWEAGPARKWLAVDVGAPQQWLSQLDRLALPRLLRGDPNQTPPGADLGALRILTKKG